MTTNLNSGGQDLDQMFITNQELIDRFVASSSPGSLWAVGGINQSGELAYGNTSQTSSPVQVGTLTDWAQVTLSDQTSAMIKTDNTLWVSGYLLYLNLSSVSSPVQVGTLTNWKSVSGDPSSPNFLSIKTDGTLWGWGNNNNGILGVGDASYRVSPVQVGSLTNWKQVQLNGHAMAIKTDGTLWAWGTNSSGQLGLNDITHRSSPIQVGVLTNWQKVSCGSGYTMAIKTDGTLWAWGSNANYGQLGLGDTAIRSSPVQVGILSDWKSISCGTNVSLATKLDGTLWAWGYNAEGNLGLGNTLHRSSPVQVGSLTDWKQTSGGGPTYIGSMAVKTDGTLWGWGANSYGPLGLGNNINRSSPVQVGSLTNWKLVATSGLLGGTMAIKN